jgi:predicted AAA+ superfamily ATPase
MTAMPAKNLTQRAIGPLVAQALTDTRIVTLNGARQTGKSTLTQLVTQDVEQSRTLLMDDPAQRAALLDDPAYWLSATPGLLVIDEVQTVVGEILGYLKMKVDQDPTPGQFLLTGSAGIMKLKSLYDALPGRMEIIEVWPFSQGEIEGTADRFIDAAFAHGENLCHTSTLTKNDYFERVVRGGYPEAIERRPNRRNAFFDSYIHQLIGKDISEISEIRKLSELRKLVNILAGYSGHVLNMSTITPDTEVTKTTVKQYLDILETIFIIHRIPAWSNNLIKRVIRAPKLIFTDSGLAASLIGQDTHRLLQTDSAGGHLLETFVLSELGRQLTWNNQRAKLYHFRTNSGIEVDAILETPDGRVVGIEVKASSTLHREHLSGLRYLAETLGDRFVAGYLLYSGKETLPFANRITAMPIEALWRVQP